MKIALVLALTLASGAAAAGPVTLDFNGLQTDPSGGVSAGNSIVEDGYRVNSLSGNSLLGFGDGWQSGRGGSNGTTVLGTFSTSPVQPRALFSLQSSVAAQPFDLLSIDLGEIFRPSDPAFSSVSRQYQFVGTLAAGGTVTATFVLDLVNDGPGGVADFQTFNFSSAWTGLSLVSMNGTSLNGTSYGYIDNLVVQQTTAAVPEPASLALAAVALLGVAASRGRKQRSRIVAPT
jgi:hypothetical protein